MKQEPVLQINTSPSEAQIRNAVAAGWDYLGNGDFIKESPHNSQEIFTANYTNRGFKIE